MDDVNDNEAVETDLESSSRDGLEFQTKLSAGFGAVKS